MEFSGRMILCGVRVYHALLDLVEWFMPTEVEYSSSWKICNPKTSEYITSETREELCFTDEYSMLIHYVRKSRGLLEDFRAAIHWPEFHREGYRVQDLFDSPRAPWLFVGYRDGENTVDCTDMLSQFVCNGNVIHNDLLHFLVPGSQEKTWVYIHPKTFEETEFPSDGIVIGEEDGDERGEEDGDEQPTGNKKND